MTRSYKKILSGWGQTKKIKAETIRPEYVKELTALVSKHRRTMIPYGFGRSYGDQALNSKGLTLITNRLNHFIHFNKEKMQLVCEGGVTLQRIQQTFLPKGYGLITSPGTSMVSVGGAIANDVHGKNHDHVGSFGDHVLWLLLLTSTGEIIKCSAEENQDIFYATIGGMGLTGVIVQACLQLCKQENAVKVTNLAVNDISTMISTLIKTSTDNQFSVGWLDLANKRKSWGSGYISIGNSISCDHSEKEKKAKRLPTKLMSPFLNAATVKMFNWVYLKKQKR